MPSHDIPLMGFRDHTHWTHHTRYDASVCVTGPKQRPLPDNTHKRKTSMPPTGFEPAIPASKRPQTLALDRAATGIGKYLNNFHKVTDCLFLMTLFHVHILYRMMKYKIPHNSAQRQENFGKTVNIISCIHEHCTV